MLHFGPPAPDLTETLHALDLALGDFLAAYFFRVEAIAVCDQAFQAHLLRLGALRRTVYALWREEQARRDGGRENRDGSRCDTCGVDDIDCYKADADAKGERG